MKIGILSKNYAAQRLFLDKLPECQYKDVRFYNWCLWKNAYLWGLKAIGKLKMSPEEMVAKLFYDFKMIIPTGCDVFHFFNCINLGKHSKWVISVESGVPWPVSVTRCVESEDADLSSIAQDKYVERRIKALANPNCLGLLALSHCTENIQREIIKQFPQYESIIAKKMITLLPPQKLIIGDVLEKGVTWSEEEPLTFIYVGSDFYRKGGRETVQVLSELHKRYSFKLILISSMAVDEKRYMRTENDEKESKYLIERNKDWIEYYDRLPNTEVLEKMKKAHVCLLPTWMDTFAYSVLEAQACGAPVIAFGKGGACETVIQEKTGIFFPEQTSESLADAICRFEELDKKETFKKEEIVSHARSFTFERFKEDFLAAVDAAAERAKTKI